MNRPEQLENISDVNFDHPNSLDFDEAHNVMSQLSQGRDVEIPNYSFIENAR